MVLYLSAAHWNLSAFRLFEDKRTGEILRPEYLPPW
jgi:hypothetical protein